MRAAKPLQPEFEADVIQSILFFALGFLTAGFLALLIAPAFWRRAVNLTRKRVEASVPMTLDEIHADKDRIRAEFAMSARRLEMSAQAVREKNAAQIVEIGRGREEIKALNSEIAEKNGAIAELQASSEALRAELRQRADDIHRLSAKLAENDEVLNHRATEVEKLGRMYDDASFSSSSRQIELVARESELEQLRAEAKKVRRLERKIADMLSAIADREEKLERGAKELARATTAENDLNARLVELQADMSRHEARAATSAGDSNAQVPEKKPADRERLESRLTALTRENRKLKADLKAAERGSGGGDEVLRERIGELAAQMVHLTSVLDGQGSPIAKLLSSSAPDANQDAAAKKASLADRVRALQKAASAG